MLFKAISQGLYDRKPLDRVSSFLSELVSCLLSTDPQRRPSADQVLRRIRDEREKGSRRSEPQNLTREEDDGNSDTDDSDYETLVKSNPSGQKSGDARSKSLGKLEQSPVTRGEDNKPVLAAR